MVLATGLDRADRVAVRLDVWTNTEIALCKPAAPGAPGAPSAPGTPSAPGSPPLTSASCASGPAFEGAHIHDGMRAADGAIEGIRLTPDGAELRVVGNTRPVGICGSGIVDAIAELRRTGRVNERGRLRADAPGVRRRRQGHDRLEF